MEKTNSAFQVFQRSVLLNVHSGLFLLLMLLSFSVSGQVILPGTQPSRPLVPDQDSVLAPQPIPLDEITNEQTRVIQYLREIKNWVDANSLITEELEEDMEVLDVKLLGFKEGAEKAEVEMYSLRNLVNYDREWAKLKEELLSQEKDLSGISKKGNEYRADLDFLAAVWKLTSEKAVTEQAPKEVRAQIRDVTHKMSAVSKSVKKITDHSLSLNTRVGKMLVETSENIAIVEGYMEDKRLDLFSRDAEPFFKALGKTDTLAEELKPSVQFLSGLKRTPGYLKANSQKVLFHFLLVLFVSLFFLVVGRRLKAKQAVENSDLKPAYLFSRNPIIVGLMVGLGGTSNIYPGAPILMLDIASLLLVTPLVLLLPKLLEKSVVPAFYLLMLLYALNLFLDIIPISPTADRLVLLLEAFVGISALFFFYRSVRSSGKRPGHLWVYVVNIFIPLAILALAGTIVGNLSGYVAITKMVIGGVFTSIGLAIVLAAFSQVVLGLAILFLDSKWAQNIISVRVHRAATEKFFKKAVHFIGFFLWALLTLMIFELREVFLEGLVSFWAITWDAGSISISVGGILSSVIVLFFTWRVADFVQFFLGEELLPRFKMGRGVPGAITMVTRYVIITFGLFLAIAYTGVDMSKFTILVGALGVGIGFGLQSIFNNLVSGLIIAFERPIQIGDVVEVGPLMGHVREIGFRSSRIKTFDGAEVVVPNGNLISSEVINWTLSDQYRRGEIEVGVAYGSNPRQVRDILLSVLTQHSSILVSPSPAVLFKGFGDSSLNFRLWFWTSFDNRLTVESEVGLLVFEKLAEEGIEIPFPQQDLYIKSMPGDNLDSQTAAADKDVPSIQAKDESADESSYPEQAEDSPSRKPEKKPKSEN